MDSDSGVERAWSQGIGESGLEGVNREKQGTYVIIPIVKSYVLKIQ